MAALKPFFPYYGNKARLAPKYASPLCHMIIEPFAGSAGYSLLHSDRQVHLYDLNEKICAVWNYLIKVSSNEIINLPDTLEDYTEANIAEEAKWLMGYYCAIGSVEPRNKVSPWAKGKLGKDGWAYNKQLIARQLQYIRHWICINKSYENIDTNFIESTWFIDPPYCSKAGQVYTHCDIDYKKLAKFCKSRLGQTIVCEMYGADWLPFKHLSSAKSLDLKGKPQYAEVVWYQEKMKEKRQVFFQ
jgi:hypothetical protein